MKYILYFFVYLTNSYTSKNSLGVYQDYFEKGQGFLIALAIAVIVALLIAMVFYFGFGKKSLKMCSNKVWIGSLVVCLLLSFAGTYYSTGVTSISSSRTGRWGIAKVLNDKQKKIPQEDAQRQSDLRNMKKAFEKPLAKSTPIQVLCLENTILSGLFFLLFSWFIRWRLLSVTNYAQPYPTFWSVKRRKNNK